MNRITLALSLALISMPALAAQPADGIYACTRGDTALGDIEIAGTTFRTRTPGGEFAPGGDYIMLDDASLFWMPDPAIIGGDTYSLDNTKLDGAGFIVTVLEDDAADFETVACVPAN